MKSKNFKGSGADRPGDAIQEVLNAHKNPLDFYCAPSGWSIGQNHAVILAVCRQIKIICSKEQS